MNVTGVNPGAFKDMEKVLVIKLRHIGDVLCSVPALRALKETFPQARLTALVNSETVDMLTLNPDIDEVICYERDIKTKPLLKRISYELGLAGRIRKMGFDMTVDFTGGDRAAVYGFISGARVRIGYLTKKGFAGKRFLYTHLAEPPELEVHSVLRDYYLVKHFGSETGDLGVNIFTSPDDESSVEKIMIERGLKGVPFVHVHPTSRWFFKCWTDEGMASTMDFLFREGFRVVITSGPGEKEMNKVRSIRRLMKSAPVDLSGALSLKQLAALSKRAAFFFGIDSAPMHVAASVGTPVVALFGPSGAFNWGPWDNDAANGADFQAALRSGSVSPYPAGGGVKTFGSHTVIQRDWECIPCGIDGCNGSKKSDCLIDIKVDEVKALLSERFSLGRKRRDA